MHSSRLSFLLFVTVAFVATICSASHVLLEKRNHVPQRWIKRDRVKPASLFPVRIALAQTNLDNAHDMLMDVSSPDSPNYGKHWTSDEVIAAFQPAEDSINAVRQWLNESGISDKRVTHSDNKVWFAFHASAKEMEDLLRTEFHEYEDQVTGGVMPACDAYHVPEHISRHVDYVSPGIRLHAPEKRAVQKRRVEWPSRQHKRPSGSHLPANFNASDLSTCDQIITPACIQALYGIPEPGNSHVNPNNSMGIFESELQYWDQTDLNLFFENYTPRIPDGTHPIDIEIDGGVAETDDVSQAGSEAMLDLELAYPIIYPQTITVYNVDDLLVQEDPDDTYTFGFNTFLDALDGSYCTYSAYGESGNQPILDQEYPDPQPGGYKGPLQCGVYKPTNVISLSYGGQEDDLPVAYQKRQCNEYLKLGLQGVSFFFASGDTGVGDFPDNGTGFAIGVDGPTGCLGPNYNIFNPTWPNTCPYVTNVGATTIYPGHTVYEPESAVIDPNSPPYNVSFSSSGGFSNVYPIPDYQKAAVSSYFKNHNPPYPYYSALANQTGDIHDTTTMPNVTALAAGTKGVYNRIGRGVPDVSATSDNIATYLNGAFQLQSGTSASCPIFAAIVNRIVEARLAAGKTPVGFINPALYANPGMLNDITNGTNPGCGTPGFSAVPGWDPVTGLGTPNYPKMLKYFLSLP